ncbi:hypothetical protein GTA08_BOTSDO02640 [Botryosphaeria dothidea]|uniref:Beta-lactamase-related domain-containing protein n=1 Tax=Botryosphaeria dothidea TaxID=55169 RepID=A0A8H4J1C9_9PEZI|nr:hypothetical protein GTA08_BOTSDO02640 [Botryosphaeria dothidea]
MDSFDQVVESFLKNKEQPLPRVTVGAVNRSGSFKYVKSFGDESGGPEGEAADVNALYWIASCSKLITTIAAFQCVEKGLLTLDDDISKVLPEWKDPKILTGHDENKQPIFKPAKATITLRLLLTHSSGIAYSFTHPLVAEYQQNKGVTALLSPTIAESYPTFLVEEPGVEWRYSPGIDWAGQMVERVTKTKLNDYIAEHIFKHLNITDTTFHLPDSARRSTLWMRTEAGPLAPAPHIVPSPIPDAHGGAGLYASAPSLLAVYAAVLRQDPEILKAETWRMMFTEQLRTGGKGLDDLEKYGPEMRNNALGSLPDGVGRGFGFGGILVREDTPGRRAKGSMSWSGLPNCYWFIDQENGVAGVYLSQLLPTGDNKSVELFREFENTVYKAVKGQ